MKMLVLTTQKHDNEESLTIEIDGTTKGILQCNTLDQMFFAYYSRAFYKYDIQVYNSKHELIATNQDEILNQSWNNYREVKQ